MTLYDIKPKFQNLLRPCLARLSRAGVTANQVTLTAWILSWVIGGILVLFPQPVFYILLPIFLFIRMALNAIDGMLAREYNQKTRKGALLNEIGDVVSDAALILPFALLPFATPWLIVLCVIAAMLTEFCGVLAQTIGAPRGYAGPLGKSDRAFVIGAYGLCIFLWPFTINYSFWVFAIMLVLLIWTCVNRCQKALKQDV